MNRKWISLVCILSTLLFLTLLLLWLPGTSSAANPASPTARILGQYAPPPTYTVASVITVTSASDPDTSLSNTCYGTYSGGYAPPGDGYGCTLRRAVVEVGRSGIARPVLIKFNIPLTDSGYISTTQAWKIELMGALPSIGGGQVIIDGDTQDDIGGRDTGPKIIIHGSDLKLAQYASHTANIARALAIQNGGIYMYADDNIVEYNWVGLTDDGQGIYYDLDDPTRTNGATIYSTTDHNTIKKNVVSTARIESIVMQGDYNTIVGNYVGTNADGTIDDVAENRRCHPDAVYDNWFTGDGIHVSGDHNQIGGPTADERNVIVGMLFASVDPDNTPPIAIELNGDDNLVQNNYIGRDADGDDAWVCGMGFSLDGQRNRLRDNAIVNAGTIAFGIYGSSYSLDALTLRGNVVKNVPVAIDFGSNVPMAWKTFNPAQITGAAGTTVSGTAGDNSPCANCVIELFLDDGDDYVEALQSVVTTAADANGDWLADIGITLAPTQALRTTTTSVTDNQIGDRDAGTTSKFSDLYPDTVTPPDPTPTPPPTPPPAFPTPTPPLVPTWPVTYATVITVTSADDPDTSPSYSCYGSPGITTPKSPCTLRRAIVEASNYETARPVLIKFNIPTTDTGYLSPAVDAWKIELMADLPYAGDSYIVIDGETQGEIGGRSDGPKIIVYGGNIRMGEIAGDDHNAVYGIAVQDGEIALVGDYGIIENCWAGLTDDGQSIHYLDDDPTKSNHAGIRSSGDYNLIKDNVASSANIVSLDIPGSYNTVIGNYVGTRADGTVDEVAYNRKCHPDAVYFNWFTGVGVRVSGDYNWIGGDTAAEQNVVAGMLFASPNPENSPPDALEVTGHHNTFQNNLIGKDSAGKEVGACGVGIYVNNKFNRFVDNEIANTGLYALGIFGDPFSLDAITLRGNTLKDVPSAIEFGLLVPPEWTNYVPAHITGITGTAVAGTSGDDSPCPFCTVELFLDDGDDYVEALEPLKVVTTTADGSWTATLDASLAPTQGLRTASTTSDFGQIPDFEVGTTSDFSRLYPDTVTPPAPTPEPTPVPPPTLPKPTPLPTPVPPPTYATVITVTTTADPEGDIPSDTCYGTYPAGYSPPGDEVGCTLRRAIHEAGVLEVARPVLIKFNIPTTDTGYLSPAVDAWKIELMANLPYVKRGQVVIDGESQPGGRSDGPKIIVEGGSIRLGEIAGDDHNVARGLLVQGGEIAAVLNWNIIEDNWVGLTDDGQNIYYISDDPDRASYASVRASGDYNLIKGNVSSSAQGQNLKIAGSYNTVIGNYSGTDADGEVGEVAANRRCHPDALYYNWFTGVGMYVSGNYNQIGGPAAGERNVIAGMLFASRDPENSPPDAVWMTGYHNTFQNNVIGKDAAGKEVGACGVGIYVSNKFNQFLDNEIVNTGMSAVGVFGDGISLDATTLQGNTLKDVPAAIEFGPNVPVTRTLFNAAQVSIDGLNVSGTSGPDWSAGYWGPVGTSFCPYCRVELFIDDGDDQIEALESVAVTQADVDGNWSTTLGATLAPTQGLRAQSTTRNYGVIANFEISTTTRFSPLYGDPTPPDPTPEPTPQPPRTIPPIAWLPTPEPPVTYVTVITVTHTDDPDTSSTNTCYRDLGMYDPPGDGICNLRRAIIEASHVDVISRPVHIIFDIPTSDGGYDAAGFWKTTLSGALPYVKGSQVFIDGETQPGGRADGPKIVVHGSDVKLGEIAGEDDNAVRGLALQEGGISLIGDRNIVEACWVGLSDDGQTIYNDNPPYSNDATIKGGSDNNLISDCVVATTNMIGIDLQGNDNVVVGNYIGTRADGTLPDVPQADRCDAAANTWYTGVGMDITGSRNRISGNVVAGMHTSVPSSTPPEAMNIDGWHNVVQNNTIGKDATGQDVWICGQALDLSGFFNQVLDNQIASTVETGRYVFGIWGGDTSLDALTVRGNTFEGFYDDIEYGPTVPASLRLFSPALVTVISDTQVKGISDDDCPYCFVDVYLDDDDDQTDALSYLGYATATVSGDWSFTMTTALTEGYGLRTVSTVRNFGVIEDFEIGTSSKFSELFKERPPTAPSSVEIIGPTGDLWTGKEYSFLANVSPAPTTTLPISYAWLATGQTPVANRGGWDNDVGFTWDTAGTKAITVTATNAYGSQTDSMTVEIKELVALTGVSIDGPSSGYTGTQYAFDAVVAPSNATEPITYTWAPEPDGGQGTDSARYQWPVTGTYTITVAAENVGGSGVATHTITIETLPPGCSKPLGAVTISGPTSGYTDTLYAFTGDIVPPDATPPVIWVWDPAPYSGQGTSSAQYQWATLGDHEITLTAENCGGSRDDSHTITIIEREGYDVYLPLVLRNS